MPLFLYFYLLPLFILGSFYLYRKLAEKLLSMQKQQQELLEENKRLRDNLASQVQMGQQFYSDNNNVHQRKSMNPTDINFGDDEDD